MKTKKNLILLNFMGVVPKWSTWNINWFYTDGVFCHISNTDREKVRYSMAEYAKYSTSWDWIMPVVEKIEALGYDVEIGNQYVRIDGGQDDEFGIDSRHSVSKIEAVFDACVEFAKWYKNQSK